MLFLVQFLIIIGIILIKVYNMMSVGQFYDIKLGFILFIGFFLAWLVGMIITLVYPQELLFLQLWKLENYLIVLNVVFLMFEIIIAIKDNTTKPIESYKSIENSQKQLKRFTRQT